MNERTSVYELTGRKALVTGGARGLGAGMAQALAKAGAAVVIGDILEDVAKGTVDAIREAGGVAEFVHLDVTDEASWEAAVTQTIAEIGGFDILVNNAGIELSGLVVDIDAGDLRRMFDVNVVGTALGIKHAFRAMKPGGAAGNGGSVINIASVAATIAFPMIAGYSASKSAVDRLTRVAAVESGKLGFGVRVNCVYPGLVPTDMGVRLAMDMVDTRPRTQRRGRRGRGRRGHAAGPPRRDRRHGRRRGVPGLRRRPLRHRCRHRCRRWHGHLTRSHLADHPRAHG